MTKNIRLLIVDDEKELAELFGFYFAKHGWQVDWAFDGIEAIEKLSTNVFDYIISDFNMPIANGDKVYDFVNKLEEDKPKLIFLTGDIAKLSCRTYGPEVIGTYSKPISLDVIFEKIQNNWFSSRFKVWGT